MLDSAKEAYKGYVRAYDSHFLKSIFDINTLDLKRVALSFGLRVPPPLDGKVNQITKSNNNTSNFNNSRKSNKNNNFKSRDNNKVNHKKTF